MGERVCDFYTLDEFSFLIQEAHDRAKTTWENDFVFEISQKFAEYGENMYLSEKQQAVLERIANYERY